MLLQPYTVLKQATIRLHSYTAVAETGHHTAALVYSCCRIQATQNDKDTACQPRNHLPYCLNDIRRITAALLTHVLAC
jgi:hypothetical protein